VWSNHMFVFISKNINYRIRVSTTKSERHDIAEILLKVALSTLNQIKSNQIPSQTTCLFSYLKTSTTEYESSKVHRYYLIKAHERWRDLQWITPMESVLIIFLIFCIVLWFVLFVCMFNILFCFVLNTSRQRSTGII
jgi:hypothetical protein